MKARFILPLLVLTGSAAQAAETERLSIVANGETVGSIVAVSEGNRTTVDYRVDNNGRGPKHREEIELGSGGVPVAWTIAGTSLMGGPVQESYRWNGGRAEWKSQADQGSTEASAEGAAPPLYVVNDDSPWVLGVYARAALARPDGALAALPGGRISVAKVREARLGEGDRQVAVTVYRLSGINLNPAHIMLDSQNRLFSAFGESEGGVTIRAGYEALVPEIVRIGAAIGAERAVELQRKLAHSFDAPVRITNVHVFDPATGKRSALSQVVVMRDTVVRLIPGNEAVPAGEVAIDGEGGTLFPGLHDMHSHTTLASGPLYLAAGVTSVRDMGNSNRFLLDLLPKAERGEIIQPRITPAGFLEGRSPYSARLGFVPETLDEALGRVRWYADHGYYEIKIYNSMNPDWVAPLAAEAHRLGLKVSGHVPAFSNPDRVVGDGYNAIAHINQLMLGWILDPGEDTRTPLRLTAMARGGSLDLKSARVQRTVRAMKRGGVALDTTAVILEQLMLSRAGQVQEGQQAYLSHMPIGLQRYRKRSFVTLKDEAEDRAYSAGFAKVLEVIGMLHRQGVTLLPGTDDGTGLTVQREVELYTRAGLTPAEALRAATLGASEYLGQAGRIGRIERGMKADLVLVAGDPLADIAAIKRPRMVMRGGTVYFPAEIYAELGIEPFAAPPPVRAAVPETATLEPAEPVGHAH